MDNEQWDDGTKGRGFWLLCTLAIIAFLALTVDNLQALIPPSAIAGIMLFVFIFMLSQLRVFNTRQRTGYFWPVIWTMGMVLFLIVFWGMTLETGNQGGSVDGITFMDGVRYWVVPENLPTIKATIPVIVIIMFFSWIFTR